jgi:hypothetical protein
MNFLTWFFGLDQPAITRDVMQVCLEGHVIADLYNVQPAQRKAYCPQDGSPTITDCVSCGKSIPSVHTRYHFSKSTPMPLPPPERCEYCGSAFPWSGKSNIVKSSILIIDDVLPGFFERFSLVVKQLRRRHDNRETLDVKDEYDAQNLLHGLLRLAWDDVREEQWTPSYAGKSARADFLLPAEQCVIEVKMARKGLAQRELGDQLLVDIARYRNMPNCSLLYCFVYDPDGYVKNPRGVEADLEKQSTEALKVRVFIRS